MLFKSFNDLIHSHDKLRDIYSILEELDRRLDNIPHAMQHYFSARGHEHYSYSPREHKHDEYSKKGHIHKGVAYATSIIFPKNTDTITQTAHIQMLA